MRVLLLCKYSDLGASSRLRTLQYLPFLRANGFEVTVAPLLDDNYVRGIYARTRNDWLALVGSYLHRLGILLATRHYDLLWIEKELFPRLPACFESLISSGGTPYVVDYDDAVFHDYDSNPHWAVRRLLGRKIDVVMRRAAIVSRETSILRNGRLQLARAGSRYFPLQ